MPADMHYHDFKRVYVDKSLTLKAWQENYSRKLLQKSSSRILQAAAAGDKIAKAANPEKTATPLKLNEALDQSTLNAVTELVRAAPEYIQNLWNLAYDHIKIADKEFGDTPYYSEELRAIFFNLKSDTTSPIFKPYKDFFHEIGHLIDHWAKNYGGYLSVTYRGGIFAKTLKEEAEDRIKAVKIAINAETNFDAHQELSKEILKILPYSIQFEISDIWHGASERKVHGIAYHRKPDYWKKDGKANIPKEAFAHMFGASIYNPDSAEKIEHYFPRSYSIFKEMLNDFVQEMIKNVR